MAREKFETERCTKCLHVFTGEYEEELCECEIEEINRERIEKMTDGLQRVLYSKRYLELAGIVG